MIIHVYSKIYLQAQAGHWEWRRWREMTSWVDGKLYDNGIYFICPGQFTESDDAW